MEPQVVKFEASDINAIANKLKGLQPDSSLAAFSKMSDMIQKATGMLPEKIIPSLQQLAQSYSKTTMQIKVSFADTTALLSKFVVKGYRVMKRGMNNEDTQVLKAFSDQLSMSMINQLNEFVEISRTELVAIHTQLLNYSLGDRAVNLIKEKENIEIKLLEQSKELVKISSERGANQGMIEALEYQKKLFEKAIEDSEAAKEEAKKEVKALKGQIREYENEVQKRRNTVEEERGSFWIFSWKIRDIHHNNGEQIARENLERLLKRIRDLDALIANWPNMDAVKRMTDTVKELGTYTGKKRPLDLKYKRSEQSYNETTEEFDRVIKEIEKIYQLVGTAQIKSLTLIDELSRAVLSGHDSIVSTYAKIRTNLKALDADGDLLVSSIVDALQFMNMMDTYMGTTKINDMKQMLATK
ncbi:unnamed protein product [Rotaria sp. Silwood1]|nr:unnamed protein product [Rotaria sp. Silwood1]CAF4971127.1 unnamed protein product [Rotaria sp. Silwood1]